MSKFAGIQSHALPIFAEGEEKQGSFPADAFTSRHTAVDSRRRECAPNAARKHKMECYSTPGEKWVLTLGARWAEWFGLPR